MTRDIGSLWDAVGNTPRFWANQFANTANGDFHAETTGPEIDRQCRRHRLRRRDGRRGGGREPLRRRR